MRQTTPRLMALTLAGGLLATPALAQTAPGKGETRGSATAHTPASAALAIEQASLAVPASVTADKPFLGKWRDLTRVTGAKVPVVMLLHGSSGLGVKAIGEWQAWLADLGIASVAPDSFALPDRLIYGSPVAKDVYERIHALRASEIAIALAALKTAPWADMSRIALAGQSEGSPAVARYGGTDVLARIIYAWSCEDNYFVAAHGTKIVPDQPVLNVISASDPYFSAANSFIGKGDAQGHCGKAFADSKSATIVLIPGAPHTALTLPQTKMVTRAFLSEVFRLR